MNQAILQQQLEFQHESIILQQGFLRKKSSEGQKNRRIRLTFNNNIQKMKFVEGGECIEITVKCAQSCEACLQQLQKMPNLIALRIQWNPLGKKNWIIEIMKSLPKLIQLSFQCQNQFNDLCVHFAYKMQYLRKLCFGYNLDNGIQYLSQCEFYRQRKQNMFNYQQLLSASQIKKLVQGCPCLYNMWTSDQTNLLQILTMREWKHLAISKFCLPSNIAQYIERINNLQKLISLTFKDINFSNSHLLQIIIGKNKGTLKSLMIFQCLQFNEKDLKILQQCQQLKQLHLKKFEGEGKFLQNINQNLTFLHLNSCKRIKNQYMLDCLKQIKKLEYLAICSSNWVDKIIIQQVSKLDKLSHLNLYSCNNIAQIGIRKLINKNNLITLHLGQTATSSWCLLDIIDSSSNILKLGLAKLNISDKQLNYIGKALRFLTHIDLKYCQYIKGYPLTSLEIYPQLRYIDVQSSSADIELLSISRPQITIIH